MRYFPDIYGRLELLHTFPVSILNSNLHKQIRHENNIRSVPLYSVFCISENGFPSVCGLGRKRLIMKSS